MTDFQGCYEAGSRLDVRAFPPGAPERHVTQRWRGLTLENQAIARRIERDDAIGESGRILGSTSPSRMRA